MRIGICGLGRLGFPLAVAIERKGHQVTGYDTDPAAMTRKLRTTEACENGKGDYSTIVEGSDLMFADSIPCLVSKADIIFVAVQTPNYAGYDGTRKIWGKTRKEFDYTFLEKAVKEISEAVEGCGEDKVIVIICTVLPGTCRQKIKPLLGKHSKLVYNPFTVAMGTVVSDFYNQEFFILGWDDRWAQDRLIRFYKTISPSKVYSTGLENAELIKMLYNAFITTKICFANTVMEMCHKIPGADCDEVLDALKMAGKRLISPAYLSGGMADAGPCHPKDLRSLGWLSDQIGLSFDLFDTLLLGTERQSDWLASLILKEHGGLPIILLGKAFKENINLSVGSSVYLLKECLEEKGATIRDHIDPHIDGSATERSLEQRACFVLCTKHECFYTLDFPPGSIVIDVFRWLPEKPGIRYIRVGIGPSAE